MIPPHRLTVPKYPMSTYLITGASRGLGLALVLNLAARPTKEVEFIIATARTKTPALQKTLDTYPDTVVFISLDVVEQSSIDEAVHQVQSALGVSRRLDVLINNAGVLDPVLDDISKMYVRDFASTPSISTRRGGCWSVNGWQ